MVGACDNFLDIQVEFDKAGTLEPLEAQFEYGRDQFDVFYCKFDSTTAAKIAEDDRLGEIQPATVKIEGKPIKQMYYRPEFAKTGNVNADYDYQYSGFLELKDAHHSLKSGNVNYGSQESTIDETFGAILDAREKKDIITNFNSAGVEDTVSISSEFGPAERSNVNIGAFVPFVGEEFLDDVYKKAIEFDGESPFEALKVAKKKHGVTTRVSKNGTLEIGDFPGGFEFSASPKGKETELHIKSSSLSSPAQDVEAVQLKGPTIVDHSEPLLELSNIFNDQNIYEERENYRLYVTAEDPSVDNGLRKQFGVSDVTKDTDKLVKLAKRYFASEDLKNGNGTVTIGMQTSNRNIPDFLVGDKLSIQPPEKQCKIGSQIPMSGKYLIDAVRHKVGTSWDVDLEVSRPTVDVDSLQVSVEVYDTKEDQTYKHEDIFGYSLESTP